MSVVQDPPATLDLEDLFTFITALRSGDFSRRLPTNLPGRAGEIANHLNLLSHQLHHTLAEITRIASEVSEGRFGGQVDVSLPPGPWRACAEAVNAMEYALTGQIRDLVNTANALAQGRPDRPVTVPCQGETASLKDALNRLNTRLRHP